MALWISAEAVRADRHCRFFRARSRGTPFYLLVISVPLLIGRRLRLGTGQSV